MIQDRATIRTHVKALLREVLRPAVYADVAPLTLTANHLGGEPVAYADAVAGPFEPFAVGDQWGGRWGTSWFHLTGEVPVDWAGRDVVARIELGGGGTAPSFTAEAMVWVDGEPRQGLHHEHTRFPVTGSSVDLYVEAAANPVPPFHSKDWPLLQADPEGAPMYRFARAELALVDTEVEALVLDLQVLLQLLDHAPAQPRNNQVLDAVWAAARLVDRADVAGTAAAARAALAPALARPSALDHHVTAVGHAHIDTAWLWPIRETRRKCARTFANQLRLMERYPEHRFVCSQAQQYEWMRDEHPTIWDGIRERVAEGRWEPVGGMWVEPDTNVPSGEALVRQVTYGAHFFAEELGVESTELWIPDVFGYSAALPQIAREAGMRALVTQKLSWNTTNKFPHSTFWWEGNDGSRIVTHFPPANTYNGLFHVPELTNSMANFADHGRSDRSLYPFGHGDGGGGPTAEMLELARRMGDLEGLPKVAIGRASEFLDAVEADGDSLDTWVGELYLEFHRGTYTTQARVKRDNRRCEEALRAAELWSAAVCLRSGDWSTYPGADLDAAWKLLLTNQFHDILPGSSIHWVYDDTWRDLDEVLATCRRLVDDALGALVTPGDGQVTVDHRTATIGPAAAEEPAAVEVGADWADNGRLRIGWDTGSGLLTSVVDHAAGGREVLAGPANVLQLFVDHPNEYDAWDIDSVALGTGTDLVAADSVETTDDGFVVRRSFGSSTVEQRVRLLPGCGSVVVENDVDWQEHHRLLKVAFPVAVRSARATYEVQHGWIERPTVRNTSWDTARFEVCGHRWADLSETGYGVALLNDSKYGYDVLGNVLRLTLLKAPGWPDPVADRGRHRFAYALFPHAADLVEVIEEAAAFNQPPAVVAGAAAPGSVVTVDRRGVSVEAVKKADREDALVVRVCEVAGGRGLVRVAVPTGLRRAWGTVLLERRGGELVVTGDSVTVDLTPFQLATILFEV